MFRIENDGPAVRSTDYWSTEHARRGFFYLSWNAGAARLLVPSPALGMVSEMDGASEVIVSIGPWAEARGDLGWELLWEDGSDAPFAVHLMVAQSDRVIPESDQGGGFEVAVWTPDGCAGRWPGRYRRVERIPFMRAWGVQ